MHALGNDFILIDNRDDRIKSISRYAQGLCDRRFGIGADQLLVLSSSRKADFKMRIFNADGSEVEMCGNGIRCLAKYIWDNKLKARNSELKTKVLKIETLAGIKHIEKKGGFIRVDMGEPILEPERIPIVISKRKTFASASRSGRQNSKPIINYPLQIKNRRFKITCVSIGNPHAVILVDDVRSFPVREYGPLIENHRIFPDRTNVEFIEILNRKNILMRVWERGAGETMACGTGASAITVASSLLGLIDRKATVHLLGGKLHIEWSENNNHVYMTGPAVKVFEGCIEI
jgi:diaminopimelate epimerase